MKSTEAEDPGAETPEAVTVEARPDRAGGHQPAAPEPRLILVEPSGDQTVVSINRPEKRNALSRGMISQLTEALDAVIRDPTVTGVIIAGSGQAFCAGVDLNEFSDGTPETAADLIHALKLLCATVYASPKPVACAIQGFCVGGGLEMALAADFRVATDDARFAMPEVTVGIPSVIHAALLLHYIGLGRARQMLLTGDAVTARTAYEWGLVNYVVEDEQELLDYCRTLLHRVTKNYPGAVKAQKRLIDEWLNTGLHVSVESSTSALTEAFGTGVPQDLARRRLEGS
jgi:enoyl-CoA hydratase/carnithine racemase